MKKTAIVAALALLASSSVLLVPGTALGQAAPSGTVLEEPPASEERIEQPATVPGPAPARRPVARSGPAPVEPLRLGSYLVYPELVLTGLYDDNVYSTHADRISDWAGIVSPAVWLQSNWRRHFTSFHASADFTRYDTLDAENTDDYRVSAEGRYDISGEANLYGGLRAAREHEDRESPEERNGVEPTRYKAARAYAGAFRQLGRLSLRGAANVLDLDFNDVIFIRGSGLPAIINNDDRDRTHTSVGARVGYEVTPRLIAFVQGAVEHRRYDSVPDDLGFARDSDGTRAVLGLRSFYPGRYKLEAFAGRMRQDYEDAGLVDVSAPTYGANLVWQATRKATLSLFVDRTIEETTVSVTGTPPLPASSYVNTYLQANLNYRFTPAWSAYGFGSISRVDYQGIVREDDYLSAGVGTVYRVAKGFYVDLTYQHRHLESEVPSEDFRRNQLFVRLAFPFSR